MAVLAGQADILSGAIGALVGDANEDRAPLGQPCGAATGLVCAAQPWWVRRKLVMPPGVFAIRDVTARYRAFALLLLARRDLSALPRPTPRPCCVFSTWRVATSRF